MATYYLTKSADEVQPILYDGTSAYTPPAGWTLRSASDYATWRESNPPTPPTSPVPSPVGPFQLRTALILTGVASSESALDTLILEIIDEEVTDPVLNEIYKIAWRRATAIKRDYALIEIIRVALSKTHEEVDNIFRLADTV